MSNASWASQIAFDVAHVWHPFTQMKEHEDAPPLLVVRGEGCDLVLADGRRVFDGVASWWTSLHGHSHPRLVRALTEQAARLDHVMFAGFTHEPAVRLTERLRAHLPASLTRVFFSDDGSTSVEVALKMAFQAQHQRGESARTRIGALRGGYHGDTLGAVGVGELENFMTAVFAPLLLRCERSSVPEDPRRGFAADADARAAESIAEGTCAIDAYFAEHGASLAAFICEPLVQAAGGMRMWPPELLAHIRACCTRYGVLLVLDEVMTGFGRTGTMFALEQTGIVPDLLCLSKMLTGGMLPLAVTCATEELFRTFWGDPAEKRAFLHGHSFTANPIACAVAAESLALFEETQLLDHTRALAVALRHEWSSLAGHPSLTDVRTLGAIAAARLTGAAASPRATLALHQRALDHGILIRPIGDCLYLIPPLATPIDRVGPLVRAVGSSIAGD